MFKGIEDTINKIRYGNLKTRKKWFLGSVILFFALVVGIWMIFFGYSISLSSTSQPGQEIESGGFGDFWGTFKNGFLVLKDKIGREIKVISSLLKK